MRESQEELKVVELALAQVCKLAKGGGKQVGIFLADVVQPF